MTMPRTPDTPCAQCGKLLWSGYGALPAGQRTCRDCRRASAPPKKLSTAPPRACNVGATCSEAGCGKPAYVRGMCRHHYKKAYGQHWSEGNPDARKARYRAKTHKRRYTTRTTDVTPAYEAALRRKAKRCPLCGITMVDDPYLPASKELDHMVPLGVGGTHTIGNVRIICRADNLARPKDGSDYTGPVTLWALEPGFEWPPAVRHARPTHCGCGEDLISGRCPACAPVIDRSEDGAEASRLRALGWPWQDIAAELELSVGSVKYLADKHGSPEHKLSWPSEAACLDCGVSLPFTGLRGRPRKYCTECRPVKASLSVTYA